MKYIYKDNILKVITKEEVIKFDLTKDVIDIENEIARNLNGYDEIEITEPQHIYKFEYNTASKKKTSLANRVICPVSVLIPENIITYIQDDNGKEVEKKIIKYNGVNIQKAIISGVLEGVYERKTKSGKTITSLLINTGLSKPIFVTIFNMKSKPFEKYIKKIVRLMITPNVNEYNGEMKINFILGETSIKKYGEEKRETAKTVYLTEISHQEFFDYLYFCRQHFKITETEPTESIKEINDIVETNKEHKETLIKNSESEAKDSNINTEEIDESDLDEIFSDEEEEIEIDDIEDIDKYVNKIIELIENTNENEIEMPEDFISIDEETMNKILNKVKEKINKDIEYDGMFSLIIK